MLLVISLSSYKIDAEPLIKDRQWTQGYKIDRSITTANVTYRTVHPFKGKLGITIKSNNNYVVFSPKIKNSEYKFIKDNLIESKKSSFYQASFFEKAMRFNDSLQELIK